MNSKLIFAVLFVTSSFAVADSFTIIRDNIEYMCEQKTPLNPIGAIDCIDKAYSGPFSKDEAKLLCQGARNTAPAECGSKAYAGSFTKPEAIKICTGARSNGPVDCAQNAYSGPFDKTQAIRLCEKNGSTLNSDCAIKAYSGPYSKDEAVNLCKEQPMLAIRSLSLIEQSVDLKESVQNIKKNLILK